MLSAIIAVAVLGANQQVEPLFPRLFPRPTGQNALEYYVRAGDIIRAERLEKWSQYLADRQSIPNRLDYEEDMAARTAKILDLVRVGNQYPLRVPEGGEVMSAYPSIKDIAKLALQYSRVQFVRGKPDKATDALLLVTEIADHLHATGSLIQFLTAVVNDTLAMSGFHSAYTSISLNGADDILKRLIVYDSSLVVGHWNREIAMIDVAVKDGSAQYDGDAWHSLKPSAELLAFKLTEIFATEEKFWMGMSTALTKNEVRDTTNYSSLPDAFLAQRVIRNTVANRTQRRLLRLHAHIAKYRWETGALPLSLEFLADKERIDPANGQPFVYQRFTDAAYDLYSPGDQYFGAIRLKITGDEMLRGNPGPP